MESQLSIQTGKMLEAIFRTWYFYHMVTQKYTRGVESVI